MVRVVEGAEVVRHSVISSCIAVMATVVVRVVEGAEVRVVRTVVLGHDLLDCRLQPAP